MRFSTVMMHIMDTSSLFQSSFGHMKLRSLVLPYPPTSPAIRAPQFAEEKNCTSFAYAFALHIFWTEPGSAHFTVI